MIYKSKAKKYLVGVIFRHKNITTIKYIYLDDNIKKMCYWDTLKNLQKRNKKPKPYNFRMALETQELLYLNGYECIVQLVVQ